MTQSEDAKLAPTQKLEEQEMAETISCRHCGQQVRLILDDPFNQTIHAGVELMGILTCRYDGHQWPVTMLKGELKEISQRLPVAESQNLTDRVPPSLVEDIKDAERAFYFSSYKASAVLARRTIQLGLQEPPHDLVDNSYTVMVNAAHNRKPPILSDVSYGLAIEIGEYGGKGAHSRTPVTEGEARNAMFTAVRVLNELFPKPA